jgi:hypothetical protein
MHVLEQNMLALDFTILRQIMIVIAFVVHCLPPCWKDLDHETELPMYPSMLKYQFATDGSVLGPASPQLIKAILSTEDLDK